MPKEEKINLIDWIKGCCIIAVILNHLSGLTYTGSAVLFTGFAVSVMIIMAGYTSGISLSRECSYKKVMTRCLNIWLPYSISVIFGHLCYLCLYRI